MLKYRDRFLLGSTEKWVRRTSTGMKFIDESGHCLLFVSHPIAPPDGIEEVLVVSEDLLRQATSGVDHLDLQSGGWLYPRRIGRDVASRQRIREECRESWKNALDYRME